MAYERAIARLDPEAKAKEKHPHDRVFVKGLVLDCHIGVYAQEHGVTQRVRFSVDAELEQMGPPAKDSLDHAFDYDFIIKGIKSIIANRHFQLVETLAEEVARHTLSDRRVRRVTVRVEKLDKGPEAVGVEIVRAREGKPKL